MKKPIIALTLDWRDQASYSRYPWYALRENYCEAVMKAGGIPILLPHHIEETEVYLDYVDGLIITGGDFDVDPALYGQKPSANLGSVTVRRSHFEYEMVKQALKRNMPILGICGGHQLLNVVLGGDLIPHISDEIENPLEHEQKNPRHEPGHSIVIKSNSRLSKIMQMEETLVNTAHHQAIKNPGTDVIVSAVASDGVIEGIEYPNHPFCIGVQWHPEFIVTEGDFRIFQEFVKASRLNM